MGDWVVTVGAKATSRANREDIFLTVAADVDDNLVTLAAVGTFLAAFTDFNTLTALITACAARDNQPVLTGHASTAEHTNQADSLDNGAAALVTDTVGGTFAADFTITAVFAEIFFRYTVLTNDDFLTLAAIITITADFAGKFL